MEAPLPRKCCFSFSSPATGGSECSSREESSFHRIHSSAWRCIEPSTRIGMPVVRCVCSGYLRFTGSPAYTGLCHMSSVLASPVTWTFWFPLFPAVSFLVPGTHVPDQMIMLNLITKPRPISTTSGTAMRTCVRANVCVCASVLKDFNLMHFALHFPLAALKGNVLNRFFV